MIHIKIKKIIAIILLITVTIFNYCAVAFAAEPPQKSALIYSTGYSDYYLAFSNGNQVRTALVYYSNEVGNEYPAYCFNPSLLGVGDVSNYTVDITKRFTDEGLWRLITNGYPYKSIYQLGLANKNEAYFATKQAIYRYLAGDNTTYYGGGGLGEAGQRILKVIDKLLDIARNGTEKVIYGEISTQTDGQVNEYNDEYFYIKYKFNTNTQCARFFATLTDNVKDGIYIANTDGVATTEFGPVRPGEQEFLVMIPRNMEKQQTIEIDIKAYLETKPMYVGSARNAEYQSYILPRGLEEEFNLQDIREIRLPNYGNLLLKKTDKNTNQIITNVGFELYKDNQIVQREYTDEQGEIHLNLREGEYTIKEINNLKKYLPNNNEYKFKIEKEGQLIELNVQNAPVKLACEIEKQAKQEIQPGEEIEYTISKILNTSNVPLENFEWEETIPEGTTLEKINTGTYNENSVYNILYKTNKMEEYKLYKEISTLEDKEIKFENLEKDEYVTNIKMVFNKVSVSFSELVQPKILVKSLDKLEQGEVITNIVKVSGTYKGEKAENLFECKTIVYKKAEEQPIEKLEEKPIETPIEQKNIKVLPKTGE